MQNINQPIQIELPTLYMGTVNAFLFKEPEPILIDCGDKTKGAWQKLKAGLAAEGLLIQDIKKVFITHAHVDHIGNAGRIVEQSGAEIWVNDYTYPWAIDLPNKWGTRMAYIEDIFKKSAIPATIRENILMFMRFVPTQWDNLPTERVTKFAIDATLEMGGMKWQSIYVPGHASSQTCFYQPETRQLFSADMLLYITPVPVIEQPPNAEKHTPNLPQMLDSYRKLAAIDIEQVYPGHGKPFNNAHQLIKKQVQRIELRKEQCYHLVKNGHLTVYEIVEIMYKNAPPQFRLSGIAMTIGYLDLLMMEGRVERTLDRGIWKFEVK